MPNVSQNFFKVAAVFLLAGIAIGLQMSISGKHEPSGAHAHLLLLGWVSSAIFGAYFAFEREKAGSLWTTILFWVSTVSSAVMSGALYLLLLGNTAMVPVLSIASLAYAAGAVLFTFIVFMPATSLSTNARVRG